MASFNKVVLIGNLGRDPELRYTAQGRPMTKFSLATSERWTSKSGEKQERTEWHNIVLWDRQAEVANQYLKKGSSCLIEGRITYNSWEDKDNVKQYRTEIIGMAMQLMGRPEGGGRGRSESPSPPDEYFDSFPEPLSDKGGGASGPAAADGGDDLPF